MGEFLTARARRCRQPYPVSVPPSFEGRGLLERYQRLAAFILATLMFLLLHAVHDVREFPYDSGVYWWLSDIDSLRHFSGAMRGYFLPLLLSPARAVTDVFSGLGMFPYRMFSSLAAALVLTWVLPEYFVRAFGGQLSLSRRLVVPFLLALFMPGVVIYPLSDLPSVLLMIGSAYLLLLALEHADGWRPWLLVGVAGVLAGAAYYTRPIYVAYVALALPAILLLSRAKRPTHRVRLLALFIVGLAIVALPQVQSNVWSGLGPTPTVPSGSERYPGGIFAFQLWSGLAVQRYETALPPGESVYFVDQAGLELYRSALQKGDATDIVSYARLAARNPCALAGIYARHVVNGLDLRDGTVYVKDTSAPGRWAVSLANFVVLFFSVLAGFVHLRSGGAQGADGQQDVPRHEGGSRRWAVWLGLWIAPVAAMVPGAIETRFFLPAYLLAWSVLAFRGDPLHIIRAIRRHPLVIASAFLGTLAVFFAMTSSAASTVQSTMPF